MNRQTPTDSPTWTTRSLLEWMTGHFKNVGLDSPRLVAEMLLSHVFKCDRMRLYMEIDRPATEHERAMLRNLVARASRGEPVQYLGGEAWFFSRPFYVQPCTLIPRPSTESLVEYILRWLRSDRTTQTTRHDDTDRETARHSSEVLIADLGTGSGAIAVSLAAQLPECRIVATDISPDILDLARTNAQRHGVESRIEFLLCPGESCNPLRPLEPYTAEAPRGESVSPSSPQFEAGRGFDVICANLPYIPDHEWNDPKMVSSNVRNHEPESALRGGSDGLDYIRPVISGAGAMLNPGGQLVVEIADCQRDAVLTLSQAASDLHDPRVLKDHEGYWRVLVAERPNRVPLDQLDNRPEK